MSQQKEIESLTEELKSKLTHKEKEDLNKIINYYKLIVEYQSERLNSLSHMWV